MGGVGKTTLTKHIHNRLLEKTQECTFWVTVSQDCGITMLQDKIANVLHLNIKDECDEDKRAAKLNQALSLRKKVVLILDDVWENINLVKVGDPLRVEGCRLIITTRSLTVCRQIGCQEVIGVKTLHMDEAWNLFRETLGRETTLDSQIQKIARSMAKVCDGLPLGILTLAGSMRGENSIHVWRNALVELQKSVMGQDDMEDKVFKVLKYSFDRLDPYYQGQGKSYKYTKLQLCFLYCSLYPEDYRIERDELVRKFISEDLVDKRMSLRAQLDQGHSALDKLVNVCLLESARDNKDCDWVKMHDLVRAMALKITEGKTMVIDGCYHLYEVLDKEKWTKDLEKMSLIHSGIMDISPDISPNCPKLTTLLLQRNHLISVADPFFRQMPRLCTLDLSRTNIAELPNSLSDLENLKVLLLGECRNLAYVPYLGGLTALRELDLSNSGIKTVPQGLKKLVNLQLLHLPYQIQTPVKEIERLRQLEVFSGRLKDVHDFNRFMRSRKGKRCSASYILVGEGKCYYEKGSPYTDYNKLTLYATDLNKREENDGIVLAYDIHHLELLHCEGLSNCLLDDFPLLNHLKSLKTLIISNCKGIECILTSEILVAQKELESLEGIMLHGLRDFMSVIHQRETTAALASPPPPHPVFLSLKRLIIFRCNKMKKLGLPVSEFPNLENISIGSCQEIEEIIHVSLPKLKVLHLIQLPRLKSICNATMICSCIDVIQVRGCPVLNKLPLFFPSCTALPGQSHFYSAPPTLKEVRLCEEEREWWDSLEWEHPSHGHVLQPFLRLG